jgi:glycosyltransferase involved in cell wall biosynthesis
VGKVAVTALLPVKWYRTDYLRQALDSILGQTSPDWRLLIIAEPEDRDELARALAAALEDPRVELIGNRGRSLAGALNTGMKHAETEFVAILLGDDKWSPDAVAVLTEQIRTHADVDFFHSSRRVVDDGGNSVSSVYESREDVTVRDFGDMERGAPVKHLLCWRRDKALSFGAMDESVNYASDDFDFPWSMAEHGAVFRAIPDCLYIYRDHRSGYRLSTHVPRSVNVRELRRILRKHGLDRRARRRSVRVAKRSYLRECLFYTRLDRWLHDKLGLSLRPVWRQPHP